MADLLETLRRISDCNYISDLHEACFAADVKKGILAINDGDYSAEEWNKAANYIAGKNAAFSTVAEAKLFLSKYLGETGS